MSSSFMEASSNLPRFPNRFPQAPDTPSETCNVRAFFVGSKGAPTTKCNNLLAKKAQRRPSSSFTVFSCDCRSFETNQFVNGRDGVGRLDSPDGLSTLGVVVRRARRGSFRHRS